MIERAAGTERRRIHGADTERHQTAGAGSQGGQPSVLRPAVFCGELLHALETTEGRRRRRKRDTSGDAIGLEMKRVLLDGAVRDDPAPHEFETWLLQRCMERGAADGGMRAMAISILEEWKLAAAAPEFSAWLQRGAPSADRMPDSTEGAP